MVVGSFGPWFRAIFVTVSGVDGDGWLVIAAAAIGGSMLYLYSRRNRRANWPLIIAAIAGIAGATVAIADLEDALGTQSGGDGDGANLFGNTDLITPAWGIWMATVSSVGLTIFSLILWVKLSRKPHTTVGTPPSVSAP
jgi:hypothetical protein